MNEQHRSFSNSEIVSQEQSVRPEAPRTVDQLPPEHRRQLCQGVKGVTAHMSPIEPTIQSLAEIRIFNILSQHPEISDEAWTREIHRLYEWSEVERQSAQEDTILPTIGVEIESPEKFLGLAIEEVLETFNIYYYEDSTAHGNRDEIAPDFHYNAHTTARMIHELIALGVVPLEGSKDNILHVPDDVMISLHVNLGVPEGLDPTQLQETASRYELEKTNGLLSIAFASPTRLRNRKTNVGLQYKGAHESNKAKRKSGNEATDTAEETGVFRVELRAMELRESSVYRMLVETQKIMAMYFSHAKRQQNLAASLQEARLADVWGVFYQESEALLAKYSPFLEYFSTAIDSRPEEVATLIETTDIQSSCRSLLTKYVQDISQIIR